MAVYTSIEDLEKRLDPQVLAGLADDVNPVPDIDDSLTREIIQQAIGDTAKRVAQCLGGICALAQIGDEAAQCIPADIPHRVRRLAQANLLRRQLRRL